MPEETVRLTILTNDQSLSLVQSLDLGPEPRDLRKSPSSRALEEATTKLLQLQQQQLQLKQLHLTWAKTPPSSSTPQVIAGAPGDGAHLPLALVPHLIPPRALLLAPHHAHVETGETGAETDGVLVHTLAQGGVPGPTPAAGAQGPGGDATAQDLDPTTETETGGDTRHIDVQDHARTLDMVADHGEEVAAAEETVHLSLPVAPPTAPLLLTDGYSTPPLQSLTS